MEPAHCTYFWSTLSTDVALSWLPTMPGVLPRADFLLTAVRTDAFPHRPSGCDEGTGHRESELIAVTRSGQNVVSIDEVGNRSV